MRSISGSIQPLHRKLPLLISALLTAVVVSFGWLAQRELGRALESAAADRLHGAAHRLAAMLSQQTPARFAEMERLAADSSLARFLVGPSDARRRDAALTLERRASQAAQIPSRALIGRDCRLLIAVGTLAPALPECTAGTGPVRPTSISGSDRAWVLPFVARGDTILYGIAAPVIGARADTLGYLVQTRNLTGNQSAREIGSLIGEGAAFLIGNASGTPLWTDLATSVSGPPARTVGAPIHYTASDGTRQFGVALDVPTTPWLVWVQMPAAAVIAPRTRTLRTLAVIALVCIVVGALGAWIVSRHVTAPLIEVTSAAEDFAAGNYARRVGVSRRDELGTLMSAFNHMAAQVESASEELRVQAEALEEQFLASQELTHELEMANHELLEAAEEAQLARSDVAVAESLLTEVLTRAPVGIAVFDADLRYVRVNEALATMHGVPCDAHLGQRLSDVAPELAGVTEPLLRRVMETGETLTGQAVSSILSNGTRGHWLASYFPIQGAAAERIGVGAIVLDTTAQRELEAQFLQAQKMEAVGRLAGGVAHDFNNLLTVIRSYADLLAEELEPGDRRREDVGEISRAADRASALTRQLLAFSRKQVLQPATMSLGAVIDGVEKMLGRLIGADIELITVNATDLGTVHADPGQIEQVIVNLVVNARDAMPDGGRITIETANVELSERDAGRRIAVPAGPYVMLAVSDTGHGMSPEVLEHLFEPFYTTKPQGQGTGLGLSTVFGIVRQSGGDVWVYSEVGHGTTFKIYLPRTNAMTEPGAAGAASAAEPRGDETIVLAEDDEALRALARRVLVRQGYTVLEARNGREALELCANYEGRIDLVLSDVVMPELGGRGLVESLAASRPGTRVLFMSGYTDDDVFRRALIDKRTEFLQKPFTPQTLSQRVRDVLNARGRDAA
jgi:PAS domain S-box-containing protein